MAESVIYLLAKHAGLTVNGQAAFILIVLVFGAGTDYALLLIARYREELRRYEDRHEAMAHAVHRAGPALVASSATVAVSMLILLVAEMNSTKGMGPVLAIGVIIALAAMLTLMPALLVIFGRWVFWPVRPTFGSDEPTQHGVWARMGKRIAVRPRAVWVGTAVVLIALAGGVAELNAHQQTVAEQFVTKPASVTGAEVQAQYFPGQLRAAAGRHRRRRPAGRGRGEAEDGRRHRPERRRHPEDHQERGRQRPLLPRGGPDRRAGLPGRAATRSTGSAPRCTRCPEPTPWSAADRRSRWTSPAPPAMTAS